MIASQTTPQDASESVKEFESDILLQVSDKIEVSTFKKFIRCSNLLADMGCHQNSDIYLYNPDEELTKMLQNISDKSQHSSLLSENFLLRDYKLNSNCVICLVQSTSQ